MKLLHRNIQLFKKFVTEAAVDLSKIGIDLSDSKNSELWEEGSHLLVAIIQTIADGLTEEQNVHKDIFV